ncbi:MAG: ABC transporter ATP-binding protein [Mesorhizobium sp.]
MAKEKRAKSASEGRLLEIRNLRIEAKVYPPGEPPRKVTIVDDVSLTLERGKVLGLIGESGAGKSTIGLSSMAYGRGGVEITGGEVIVNGRDILKGGKEGIRKLRGNEVCYVAQSAAASFNPAHRLMDQVVEAAILHGTATRTEAEKRAKMLFRKLSLPNPDTIGDRYPHQVSGGQLQRVMTAMALCSEPDLIVFDEPTTALDVTTQIDVLAAIKDAIRDTGVAALYITHDLAVVAQVSDEIMVLRHGKLVEWGGTRQIIKEPRQEYTNALVSVHHIEHQEKKPTATPVLSVKNVTAAYGGGAVKVLKNVSVDIFPGQTLAVVGESGSGKSTMARAITGLLPPEQGTITFAGRTLSKALKDRKRDDLRELQMIYQMADVAMNPRQTVGTIIGRPLEFYFGIRGAERDKRVAELLEKIEMGKGFIDRYPAELSGGQKQRVCIARSLAAKPKLIICDEVTSALDPLVANGILKLLLGLQAEEDVAYLFITHDLATVKSIADSIAVMYRGEVVRYGTKSEVLAPPFDAYTDLLLSSVPEMEIGWLEKAIKGRRMEAAGN